MLSPQMCSCQMLKRGRGGDIQHAAQGTMMMDIDRVFSRDVVVVFFGGGGGGGGGGELLLWGEKM